MILSDRQKMTLALRRMQRAFAVAIYPPFGNATVDELDAEFQKGLDIGFEVHQDVQTMNDAKSGKRKVSREVMGQNDDGSPNGDDYQEQRWVTDWRRV